MRATAPLALVLVLSACTQEQPPPESKEAPTKFELKKEPADPDVKAEDEGKAAADEAFAEEQWETDEADDDAADEDAADGATADDGDVEPPKEPHAGPCKINWSGGTILRFTYDDTASSGTIRIDTDRDAKSDICGKFELSEGKTTRVRVDEGCNKSFEIELKPEYDEKANIATASYKEGGKAKHLTLVTLPTFTGIVPGFPLHAKREDIKLKISKGLVRSAHVETPLEGPPVKLVISYDAKKRVKRVKVDLEADGTTDQRFDYRFDDVGNVSRVSVVSGSGDKEIKSSASVDYRCWK